VDKLDDIRDYPHVVFVVEDENLGSHDYADPIMDNFWTRIAQQVLTDLAELGYSAENVTPSQLHSEITGRRLVRWLPNGNLAAPKNVTYYADWRTLFGPGRVQKLIAAAEETVLDNLEQNKIDP
jgi:hypothetical protein